MERTLVEILRAKRDGLSLEAAEIHRLVDAFVAGQFADYQMSAFLMAVFFRGLDPDETVALTKAMLHSGSVLDLSRVPGFKVDKHSTGGVGDKVSIALAPLVASVGVPVPMVSGRGLGHSGGTLDKLEAIPGFCTALSVAEFARIVQEVGTCMIGQTSEIAPADKRMYALRDVTATVECVPLIVASILSKKLAEGIDGLVLDVKVGRGAFMKTMEAARVLAEALVRVGCQAGKKVTALLTNMDHPLGQAIGNANETREAIDVLHGKGPSDTVECTLALGVEMLRLAGRANQDDEARSLLESAIRSGAAARTMERMVEAQRGDPRVVADPGRLLLAPEERVILAPRAGYVSAVDAFALGSAVVAMGGGRIRAEDKVDPGVGIGVEKSTGDRVEPGEVLARVYLRKSDTGDAMAKRVASAFVIAEVPPARAPLLLGRVEGTL